MGASIARALAEPVQILGRELKHSTKPFFSLCFNISSVRISYVDVLVNQLSHPMTVM